MVNKPPIWDILEINANPLREKGLGGGGVGHVEMTVNEHKSLTLTSLLYWNEIKVCNLFSFLFVYGRRFVSSSHPKSLQESYY